MLTLITLIMSLFSSTGDGNTTSYLHQKDTLNKNIYSFVMTDIDGKEIPLSDYKGKILLIVNVASECGYTPQYKQLQEFYEANKNNGVEVLGFPANDFGSQEPGTNMEIKNFCERNYGVTFPVFSKITVKGDNIHPLYRFLTTKKENGVMDAPVKWNFNKFLIDREGRLVTWFESKTNVDDEKFLNVFNELLKQQ